MHQQTVKSVDCLTPNKRPLSKFDCMLQVRITKQHAQSTLLQVMNLLSGALSIYLHLVFVIIFTVYWEILQVTIQQQISDVSQYVVNKVFDQGSKETMGKATTHSQSLNSTVYGWARMELKIW